MAKTLVIPTTLDPLFNDLFDFCQRAWELGRRARKNYTDPNGLSPLGDTITLEQAVPATEQTNVEAVLAELERVKALLVKVDDAMSELDFALNFLKDRAYRKPPLPVEIEGPHFDTVTASAP